MTEHINTLYTADCLYVLHGINSAAVDLIYLDPPFNTKRMYEAPVGSKAAGAAFKDMWTWQDVDAAYLEDIIENYPYLVQFIQAVGVIHSKPLSAYLTYMAQRIIEMHRVLKPTGSFYLHCDPTASHYLKILCDRIFGKVNFRNEICWHYNTGGASKRRFSKKHDLILYYTKSNKFYFAPQRESYREDKTDHFIHTDPAGRKYRVRTIGGKDYTYYKDEGRICHDVWEIDALNAAAKERTGYPTQKPLALLDRIIRASSKKGGVVLDPFCGCATAMVAAQQLNRRWIGIDISDKTAELIAERLADAHGLFTNFAHRADSPRRTDIKSVPFTANVAKHLYKAQDGKCNACLAGLELRHLEKDHIIPQAKGGGDYLENYQLLCGNCNRVKGDRPMAYLQAKIKKRNDALTFKVSFGT